MIAFWVLAVVTVTGAILTVTLRNIVHCVLAAVLFFTGIAGLYFNLRAEFLGASQILIYVGAVATLILFAIMLTRGLREEDGQVRHVLGSKVLGLATAAAVLGLLLHALASQKWTLPGSPGAHPLSADIGRDLLTSFLLPFEVVALLLTAALVGAIVIALDEKKTP